MLCYRKKCNLCYAIYQLRTKDAHGLYEQFGWNKLTEEQVGRYMNKHNPDVYTKRGID